MAITRTAAGMAAHGAHAATNGSTHHGHLEPKAPRSGDPRFIAGSTGEFGQSATIKQKDGPAYGGRPVAKDQNDNDRKQNNYGVTDANFMRTLGVIADPDSGQPMSYAQTMQAYNAAGSIQQLFPDVYAKLVANQDAGRGTVLGGALAIFGITQGDGAGGASLRGIDQASISKVRTARLGDLGMLRDVVLDTRDFKGREWNRAHHSGSSWTAMGPLVEAGFSWSDAALLTGDSMISWSGRVLGSNNQDGDVTGFAADELAGLKYLVLTEQATGRRALESVLGGHAATHLPEDKLTDPKINALIGLPKDFRASTPEEIAMVAGRIRSWALQPGVQVDQGEFEKFVKAGAKTPSGRALAASGLLAQVQFKPAKPHTGGGDGGAKDAATDAATVPTGLGGGPLTTNPDAVPLEQLGVGGPFQVIDPKTGILDELLQQQLRTAFIENLRRIADSAVLEDDEEDEAFDAGAVAGAAFLKDAIAVDPQRVARLKQDLHEALADGKLSKGERATLAKGFGAAGMDAVADAIKDGSASKRELALIEEQVDGAVAAKLEQDMDAALEDGKLDAKERASLEGRLGAKALKALDASIKDGTVTKEELEAMAEGVETSPLAGTKDARRAAKAGTANEQPATTGTEDARAGAKGAKGAKGAPVDAGAKGDKAGKGAKGDAGNAGAAQGSKKDAAHDGKAGAGKHASKGRAAKAA